MRQSVVGIIQRGGRFLLGLRLPGGEIGAHWEFPGGKCEAGESHTEALIREYNEELGISISVGRFIAQKHFRNARYEFDLFAYEVIIADNQKYTSCEHSELKWFSLDELQNIPMVPSDALFISALRSFYKL